jgi:hypothetical protein
MSRLAEATDILKKIKPKNRLEEAEALLSEINQPLGFQTQQMEPIVESDPDYQMSLKEAMSKKPVFDKPTIATQIDGMPQNKPVQPDFESVIRPEEKPSWGDTLYQSLFSGMLESGKQLAGIGKLPTQLINAGREIGQKYAQRMATRWDPAKSIGQIVAKKPEIEPIETEQTRNINQTLEGAEQIQGLINEKLEKGTPAQKYLGKIIQSLPPVVSARLLGSGYGNGLSAFMTLAGSSYAREAELEGATPAQQLVYGGIMGLIEGGTEYLTLGKTIDTIFQQGGKPALMAWLKSIPENALQEVAADVASALTKRATYQPEAQLPTIGELGESAALGAGTAGLLGAGAMIPNISQQEVIPEVQSQVQSAQGQIQTPEYTGPDRRVDLETRQQVDNGEVTPEQLAELRRQKEFLEERERQREAEPIVETNPILEPSQNKEAVSVSQKEPWQMSLLEYGKSRLPQSQASQVTDARQVASFSGQHIKDIKAALSRGEEVPVDILREYRGTEWADNALRKYKTDLVKSGESDIISSNEVKEPSGVEQSNTIQTEETGHVYQGVERTNSGGSNRPNEIQNGEYRSTTEKTEQKLKPSQSEAVSVSPKGQAYLKKAKLSAEEAYTALFAKKNGLEWFKKEYSEIKNPEATFKEITEKLDTLNENEQKELGFDLQFFAMQDPLIAEKVKKRIIEKYGVIKPGEAPRLRDVKMPVETEAGKTRQFARTAAEILPEASSNLITEDVLKDKFAYEPLSNKDIMDEAVNDVSSDFDKAYRRWQGIIVSGKRITAKDIALGEALLTKAAKDGNLRAVEQLTIDLASELTNAGQTVQAARLLKKMTPEGQLVLVQREIDKINRDLKRRFGNKAPEKIELTDAERDAILNAPNYEARQEASSVVMARVISEIPATWWEKIDAWRKMSMLSGIRTHVRNIAGNTIFVPMRKFADLTAIGLEKAFVPEGQRTKSVGWTKNNKNVDSVNKSWDEVKDEIGRIGKWEYYKYRKIFKTKALENYRKFIGNALESQDVWYLERAYKDALGQYMKVNKLTTPSEAAVNYATRKALEATYKDASQLADLINYAKRRHPAAQVFIDTLIPFVKTPINIMKRGLEYSPVGALKSLTYDLNRVRTGKLEAYKAVENLAKGLTGSTAFALGLWLASKGIITGSDLEDKEQSDFSKSTGWKPFSLKIGDAYIPLSWMTPVTLPVFMGVMTHQAFEGNAKVSDAVIKSITASVDSLLDLPMFTVPQRILQRAQYGELGTAGTIATDIVVEFIKPLIPTFLGHIGQSIDDKVRSSYSPRSEGRIEELKTYYKSRLPGFYQTLPTKVDVLGEEVKQEKNAFLRTLLNVVSPTNISKTRNPEIVKYINDLYEETGNNDIFPDPPPKYATEKGVRYDLTNADMQRWNRVQGAYIKNRISLVMKSKEKPTIRAQRIERINRVAREKAKRDFIKTKKAAN